MYMNKKKNFMIIGESPNLSLKQIKITLVYTVNI